MKYSFIVPVYNGEKYLMECVQSLLGQTYTDFEILLIDDGSTDKSTEICDHLAQAFDFVSVVHIENGGVSQARNLGIGRAVGEYVCFVDCDDVVHPTMLETAEAYGDNADLIFFGFTRKSAQALSADFGQAVCIVDEKSRLLEKTIYDDGQYLKGVNGSTVWAKLFKRSVIGDSQFPIGIRVGEDKLFNFDVFRKCSYCLYIPAIMYYCRTHGGSVMSARQDQYFISGLKTFDILAKLIEETPEAERMLYHDRMAQRMVLILKNALVLDCCHRKNRKPYSRRKKEFYEYLQAKLSQELLSVCKTEQLKQTDRFYFWLYKKPFFIINLIMKNRLFKGAAFFLYTNYCLKPVYKT